MTTVKACIASLQNNLSEIFDLSNAYIANLNRRQDTDGYYTLPWQITSDNFRKNFFPNSVFSVMRCDISYCTLSEYHASDISNSDLSFNIYNYVLDSWNNDISLNNWNVESQIYIRRDLLVLNSLKHWRINLASFTWVHLLKTLDKQEEYSDNIPNNTITTRQNSGKLKVGDLPIISVSYRNRNVKIKSIELRLHFEII